MITDLIKMRLGRFTRILSGVLLMSLSSAALAQNVVLDTQAKVDAFLSSETTEIDGSLRIYFASDVTNLDGLANLTTIGGDLTIQFNYALENIEGLSNLLSVGGGVNIAFNPLLENIDGLSSVMMAGAIRLEGNSALTNLDGFSSLMEVTTIILIVDNESLNEYCGLYTLLSVPGSVGGSISIFENGLNPTPDEIVAGGGCPSDLPGDDVIVEDPAGDEVSALEGLLAAFVEGGILNKGQANAINKIICNAPSKTLLNKMNSLIRSRILTEEDVLLILNAAAESIEESEPSEEESEAAEEEEEPESNGKLNAAKGKAKGKGKSK